MSLIKSKLVMTCLKQQDIQRKFDLLKEESNAINNDLHSLKNDPEIREFIISLLGTGPRLSENSQFSIDHPMKIVSGNSEKIVEIDPTSLYFDPSVDEWEIVGIEDNEDCQYRILIEAVKNRKYQGISSYIMDTFWTPWFKL